MGDPVDILNGTIDIPVRAQSAVANHSFLTNAQFVVFDHPKFGLIPCIVTIADIQQGEEILVGYGYGDDLEASPDWYQLAWENSYFGQQGLEYKGWLDNYCFGALHAPLGDGALHAPVGDS